MPPTENNPKSARNAFPDWMKKVIRFIVMAVVFGWLYGWASPRMFPAEVKFGFARGLVHGGMMPLALPALVMGENVEIYGRNNDGRSYNIGYICGINLCGLIFFGSAFWSPKRKEG